MITYYGGAFGFKILARWHGSAVFKSLTPAVMSSIVYILLQRHTDLEEDNGEIMDHPYPMGALVGAFTFLLAFRANFSYNRYWEAMTAVHLMHSKWLDFATEVAAFHYQAARYDNFKPPSFGASPHVTSVHRERERLQEPTREDLEEAIESKVEAIEALEPSLRSRFRIFGRGRRKKSNISNENHDTTKKKQGSGSSTRNGKEQTSSSSAIGTGTYKSINKPKPKSEKKANKLNSDQVDVNGNPYSSFVKTARGRLRAGGLDPDHPPLFLEEAAHLLSLLSAVAMSTLRNDLEEAESPLAEFRPGVPFPHADPDAYSADVRKGWAKPGQELWTPVRFLLGLSRTDGMRTLYNAARPFRVIGNVSDAEIELLQTARGPLAKVALCTMWLQEFISREYLSGSTGKVAPPIISRLYQFISDGMAGYNQARKIAYIPFPFPHAQMTTLFVLVTVGFIPVLMLTFLTNTTFGFVLNMLTVMCFTGLHEVARELENPFQNVPNDIPLNNFQGQFNEGLMTMFFAYHPDAYWEVTKDGTILSENPSLQRLEVPLNANSNPAEMEVPEKKES